MGMFDWIDIKLPCPKCGREIGGFQSKDGERMLECLEFWKVDNFYSYCNHCKAMLDYALKEDTKEKIRESIDNIRKVLTINEYELNFRDSAYFEKIVKRQLEDMEDLDNIEKDGKGKGEEQLKDLGYKRCCDKL